MKTNHRRGFKDDRQRYKGGTRFARRGLLSDVSVTAMAEFDPVNGRRGLARSVRGAKKFVNSRFRHHENAATRKLVDETE